MVADYTLLPLAGDRGAQRRLRAGDDWSGGVHAAERLDARKAVGLEADAPSEPFVVRATNLCLAVKDAHGPPVSLDPALSRWTLARRVRSPAHAR